jgi:putative DNA primase/helicase
MDNSETTAIVVAVEPARELLARNPTGGANRQRAGWVSAGLAVAASARKGVPNVDVSEHDQAVIDAWKALADPNRVTDPREFLFYLGGKPARFVKDKEDESKLVTQPLSVNHLRHRLNEVANWGRRDSEGKFNPHLGCSPDLASLVLAAPDPPLPAVNRLVDAPVLTREGLIVSKPGYNSEAKVFYHPAPGLDMPDVSMDPDRSEMEEARGFIVDELLGDFPFCSAADRAHAVCLFLQPFVRELINGPTPLYASQAPTAGSGKGLLARVCTSVAAGGPPRMFTGPTTEEEWNKTIVSELRNVPTVVMIDNWPTEKVLRSATFSAVLTTTLWSSRKLGGNEMITLPNKVTWVVTGNNISTSGEMTRRVVLIKLDSGLEHPEDRPAGLWRYPDLEEFGREDRGSLIWAALTLARYWIAAGSPPGTEVMGSFESWASVMGGILRTAEIPGLLCNRDEQRAQANTDRDELMEMLHIWKQSHGDSHMKAADVADGVYAAAGLTKLADNAPKRLGHKLRGYVNSPSNGLVLRQPRKHDGTLKTKDGVALWFVAPSGS